MLNLAGIKFGSVRSNCQIKFSTKFSSYTVYGREDKFVQADTNQYHAVTASYYFVVLAATSAENWIISILVVADQVSLQILNLSLFLNHRLQMKVTWKQGRTAPLCWILQHYKLHENNTICHTCVLYKFCTCKYALTILPNRKCIKKWCLTLTSPNILCLKMHKLSQTCLWCWMLSLQLLLTRLKDMCEEALAKQRKQTTCTSIIVGRAWANNTLPCHKYLAKSSSEKLFISHTILQLGQLL